MPGTYHRRVPPRRLKSPRPQLSRTRGDKPQLCALTQKRARLGCLWALRQPPPHTPPSQTNMPSRVCALPLPAQAGLKRHRRKLASRRGPARQWRPLAGVRAREQWRPRLCTVRRCRHVRIAGGSARQGRQPLRCARQACGAGRRAPRPCTCRRAPVRTRRRQPAATAQRGGGAVAALTAAAVAGRGGGGGEAGRAAAQQRKRQHTQVRGQGGGMCGCTRLCMFVATGCIHPGGERALRSLAGGQNKRKIRALCCPAALVPQARLSQQGKCVHAHVFVRAHACICGIVCCTSLKANMMKLALRTHVHVHKLLLMCDILCDRAAVRNVVLHACLSVCVCTCPSVCALVDTTVLSAP